MNNSRFTIVNADILLSTDTVEAESTVIDVKNNIQELSFYESINKEYIDARIVLLDDFGFRNELNTTGTERIYLAIADATDPTLPIIEKTFFFSKINDIVKANDRSEILSIDLVEEHVYVNAIKCISRSYESTLDDASEDIGNRDLGMTMVRTTGFTGSVQGERKVIVPYLSPLEAIQWLKNRMTSKTGAPIYVHSDLYTPFFYISSLDDLLREPVVNEKLPLRYTDAASGAEGEQEALKTYYQINQFHEVDNEDSLALYEEGAIGSQYSQLDASTGQTFDDHITVRDILQDFYTNGLLSEETVQSVFDPSLVISGRPSDEYDSIFIHQVTSTNTYNQFPSYHDESQLIEGNTLYESRLKVRNKIIRQILKKNTIDITMNGALFIEKKISPGRRLRLLFLSPNTSGDFRDLSKTVDKRRSGDYLLTNLSHHMMEDSHKISARLIKLGDLPSDFVL